MVAIPNAHAQKRHEHNVVVAFWGAAKAWREFLESLRSRRVDDVIVAAALALFFVSDVRLLTQTIG